MDRGKLICANRASRVLWTYFQHSFFSTLYESWCVLRSEESNLRSARTCLEYETILEWREYRQNWFVVRFLVLFKLDAVGGVVWLVADERGTPVFQVNRFCGPVLLMIVYECWWGWSDGLQWMMCMTKYEKYSYKKKIYIKRLVKISSLILGGALG